MLIVITFGTFTKKKTLSFRDLGMVSWVALDSLSPMDRVAL